MTANSKTTKRKLTQLKEHPRQRELFPDLPDHELRVLADDMDKHGLQHPVEILPDGTIVAGHQRVRAARLLGWKEIDAIIREDLAAADPEAVEAYLVRDNLVRRQLSPLTRARCIARMLKMELGWRADREKIKECIGDQLNMTPRTVNRYLAVLNTPREVQEAFDRDEVTLVNAGKVALLPGSKKAEIAARIAAGECAKQVLQEYLRPSSDRHKHAGDAFARFKKDLERALADLEDRPNKISRAALKQQTPLLHRARKLITRLIAEGEKRTESMEDLMKRHGFWIGEGADDGEADAQSHEGGALAGDEEEVDEGDGEDVTDEDFVGSEESQEV